MVKNTTGGKHKGRAGKDFRKNVPRLRFSDDPSEMYAIVTDIYGGEMCGVKTIDGEKRRCVIRRNFRGKNKNANRIERGVWVLVGIREFESLNEKSKCDLLEVYSGAGDNVALELSDPTRPWNVLKLDGPNSDNLAENTFEFSNAREEEFDNFQTKFKITTGENPAYAGEFADINLDDI